MGTIKDRNGMNLAEPKSLTRGGKKTQNYYTKIFMTRIQRWCDHSPRARHPGM